MKNVTKVLLLLGGIAASAHTFAFDSSAAQQQLQKQINESISGQGEVTAVVADDGIVTLSGYVSDGIERNRIIQFAMHMDGVTDVRNLIIDE